MVITLNFKLITLTMITVNREETDNLIVTIYNRIGPLNLLKSYFLTILGILKSNWGVQLLPNFIAWIKRYRISL